MDLQQRSPTAYSPQLEYLIALQSEELCGSQPRRSQRLREKDEVKANAEEVNRITIIAAGSPQLFDDMDLEWSQLAQLPPNHISTPKVGKKRGRKKAADKDKGCSTHPVVKRSRRSQSKPLTSQKKRGRKPKKVNSELLKDNMTLEPEVQLDSGPSKSDATDLPLNSSIAACPQYKLSSVKMPASSSIANTTQTYSYQCMNLTQTLLPKRYPAHFIHQLPPEPDYVTGTVVAIKEPITVQPPAEICLTPNTTPTADQAAYSPLLSLDTESVASTTPSLSESLAEVFGSADIRTVLNIKLPREYRVHDFYLPVLASLLDVELERLRVILEMTQRLTLEQMQQLAQEYSEVLSVRSSSEEDE